ncbi:MBL fold metallo-hydrolase [Amycolatopsis sp. NPDC059657]|uniref:MBL fold metallo-hydrolase n=1 Tax=Amycolatopsis sp. NPDC059657 TaxID=3346899 RepID=UPI0036719DF7
MTISLTVLGSSTPYPRPDNPCSGYLVAHGETTIWLDAGPGTLAALQQYTAIDELDAIWISHMHADHSADLLVALYALLFADLEPPGPIPLYGPPGIAARLADFLTNTQRAPVEEAFEVHELHDGHQACIGRLQLTSHAVAHGFPAFGLRVFDGTKVLAYSGDTGPCQGLAKIADGADLFLCEADSAEQSPVHLTPLDAGRAAAGTGRLVLTHVGPSLTPLEAEAQASTVYTGPIAYAAPGSVFTL